MAVNEPTPSAPPDPAAETPGLPHRLVRILLPFLRLLARKSSSEYFDPFEFLHFCCIGLANTLLDFCVYFAASYVMPLAAARTLSWATACCFSYVVNKRWVFRATTKGGTPALRFIVINVLGLSLGLGMLEVFLYFGWGRITAYVITLPAIALGNYFGYKLWSFKEG